MTHARIPDFSIPLGHIAVSIRTLPVDPVLSAIDAHSEAWAVFQVAAAGQSAEIAEDNMSVALEHLLATPCASHFGAQALIRHLRWLIREEAITGEGDDVLGRLVLVREADLSRFAGSDLPPEMLPPASTLGCISSAVVSATPPAPATPRSHMIPRGLLCASGLAGELLTSIAIIAGGVLAYGFMPFA
jgi:hypothetical protein